MDMGIIQYRPLLKELCVSEYRDKLQDKQTKLLKAKSFQE